MEVAAKQDKRLASNAGIAIGPILFIIAILAILAAAIAAGSGSFTAGTTTESSRTKASALIQIGETLKVGMDRVTMENGVDLSSVVINASNSTNNVDLFSPTGGGITPPSTSLAATPGTDVWHYPQIALPSLGTSAVEQLAVLRIDAATCNEINNKANGVNTPAVGDFGNFQQATPTPADTWPFTAKPLGCVQNNDAGSTGYFFYQTLYVQ